MNHVYRLVWNRVLRLWQPVTELASQARGGAAPGICSPVRWPRHALALALGLGMAGWGSGAEADCLEVSLQTTCAGPVDSANPSYYSNTNFLTVTVSANSAVGVPLNGSGTAMELSGNNVTVLNHGRISPHALGSGLSTVSSGLVIGNLTMGSNHAVTNMGTLGGSAEAYTPYLLNLTGMALTVLNRGGGTSQVRNFGTISSQGVDLNAGRPAADIPTIAALGGGQVTFINEAGGKITGRVAFAPSHALGSGSGHHFTNAGAITGSVSLGAGGLTNTFVAESGSSVESGGVSGAPIDAGAIAQGMTFAEPGTVDGGLGGGNTLVLADTANRGTPTTINAGIYRNFSNLEVRGGTWNLNGPALVSPHANSSVQLNGGLLGLGSASALGPGAISASGGAIGAQAPNLTVSNNFNLGVGGLTVNNNFTGFTLSGALSGAGGLNLASNSTVTLTGQNNYTGGTTIASGANLSAKGTSLVGAVQNDGLLQFTDSAASTVASAISGTGALQKVGAGTLTLTGANSYSGATNIQAGTLAIGAGGSLGQTSGVGLSSGATLDIAAGGNQTIGSLSGTGGVALGANTLTLGNALNTTFNGTISGSGGLTKVGTGTQTLNGANTFTGGVTVDGGTLVLNSGSSPLTGTSATVNVSGILEFSGTGNVSFDTLQGSGGAVRLGPNTLSVSGGTYNGMISGTGGLSKNSTGLLALNGGNAYTGATQVNQGTLMVGDSSVNSSARLTSDVTVASGASVGGFGTIAGNVNVLSDGHLAPGDTGGTLTVNGNLTLAQGSQMDYRFGAANSPGAGHSVSVIGNLALNGTQLNVINAGGYGIGVYRLFDYTGALTTTNGGILGTTAGQAIQLNTGAKQINLINANGKTLNIWNANGLATPTQFGGGSGTWSNANANWTDAAASITSTRAPADSHVIFGGAGGTVRLDSSAGNIQAQGVQFTSGGYHLTGHALHLVAPTAGILSELRVGDGSAESGAWTATMDNVVTGNGLNKTGLGTLVLNSFNTYAQSTRISEGVLSVSHDANLGAPSAGLDFQGGTLRVNGTNFASTARNITLGNAGGGLHIDEATHTFTLAQALSGNGGLTKLGRGTLVLTGNNSYLSTTSIQRGTLRVGDGGVSGSISGNADIGALGSLVFSRGDRVVYSGTLSGTGNLRQDGTGTLVLTGDNTFSGATTIASGTLQVGDGGASGALGGNIINNGSLVFNRSTDSSYTGALSGSGMLSKQGAGALTLTGDSNAYTGAATLSAGTLQVDGELGGTLYAASGATLSGTGTLGQVTLASGAILSPGNAATPYGRITTTGDLTFASGSTYRVAATADGQHTSVHVGGTARLAGSVLHMGHTGNYAPATTYTVLTASGGVQGRFDEVTSNLAFLTPSLAYDSQRVDLTVRLKEVPNGGDNNGADNGGGTRPIQFADAAFTGNQRAVARALQSLPSDSALFRRVLNLPNGAPPEAFNGLSGETHASAQSVAQGVAGSFIQAPMNRMRANLNAGLLPGAPTAQLGLGDAAALPRSSAQPVWAQAFGNWTSLAGDGNAARTTQSDSGLSAGGDVAVGGGWRLGGALGYTDSRSRTGDRASSTEADSYSLIVYGGKAFEAGANKINLSLGAAYTWHRMDTQRSTNAAGLPQTLKASYNGNTSQVFGELGYAMPLTDRVTLEPFVGAGFSSLRIDGFSESGGDAALRGDAARNNVATTTLGLHARTAFESAGAQGQLHGTLGWRHAFGDVNPASTLSFVQGGDSFTANGVPVARDAALVELGANIGVSKRTTVGVIYGGQFGAGNRQHSGTLDVRYRY